MTGAAATAAMDAPQSEIAVDRNVLAAARIAAGEDVPDASPEAQALAQAAAAAADASLVEDTADHLDSQHAPSGKGGPRVSDVGGCGRALWYRECPPPDYHPLPEMYRRPAAMGTVFHTVARAARQAKYPWRHYEFEIPIPGLDRPGRIDEYCPVLGEIVDWKTCGDGRWDRIGEDGPGPADWDQVGIYAFALEQLGLPVRTLRIIAVRRENGGEETFTAPYDPAAASRALDRLVQLATTLDLGLVPPREGHGPTWWPCKICPARAHCWNLDAAAVAGRSPESYTVLGEEPDDPSIAWAAEQAYHAIKGHGAAGTRKDQAKALLAGIPPGTYGDWEITISRPRMPNYKSAFERVLKFYPDPIEGENRPTVKELAEPPRDPQHRISVKPVRAANRRSKRSKGDGDADT